MIFLNLKLLLSSGLIFIAASAPTRNEILCYEQSKYVIPMHYDIKLTTYIEGNMFYGEYNISINILNKTQHIYLYSKYLGIKNIVLIKNFKKYHENDKDTVYKPEYKIQEETIEISFMDELSPENYILNIKYYGTANEVFRIFDVERKTTWVGALHLQIIGARSIFRKMPCLHLHDLWLEATFNISIGCHLCAALSNMPLRSREIDERNMIWKHFNTTPVMWTEQATMIVSNYLISIDTKTHNIKMWCRLGVYIEYAKNVIENITLFLNEKWKHSNNISKVDHVAIPNFHDNGAIVFGLVLYRETDIIYDKYLYSIAHKIEVAQLVGRKVTQQWFSNTMNNQLVSDFWFKKGLITLLATYAVNKTYPDYQIINLFVVQNQHYSFNLDCDYHVWSSTSQVNSSLTISNSVRAPFILRMMQHAFTEEIFWKHIRSYINKTQLYNQSTLRFGEEIVAAAKKPDITLQTVDYWAGEEHCPLIKITPNYRGFKSVINVWIQNMNILKIDCLPVTFTTQNSPDFYNFTHHIVCRSKNSTLLLPFKEYGWIIFNIQQIGYYRVNYDDVNWLRIADYLHSRNYAEIHVLNRAQIIDDAFYLMRAGQFNSSIFCNLISYLHQERDYIAWYPVFKALECIFSTFSVAMLDESTSCFKTCIKQGLSGMLNGIKYEEIDDIDKLRICLRQEAARWACLLDDITCKREANDKLKQHLQNPAKHRLLPWWKEWTYCKGLMMATEKTWQSVYDIGLERFDTKFSEYLACSEVTVIKNYFRNLIHSKQSNFKGYQYLFYSFLYINIITKHANNPLILKYILVNFHDIRPKNVNIIAELIIIINNVYSVNLTKEINEHVKWVKISPNLFIDVMKEKVIIMQNSQKIERKIFIRNKQIERQRHYYDKIFLQSN